MQKHCATRFNAGFAIAANMWPGEVAVAFLFFKVLSRDCAQQTSVLLHMHTGSPRGTHRPSAIHARHIHYVIWHALIDCARRVHEHAPDSWMQDLSTGTVEGQKFATQRFARWT